MEPKNNFFFPVNQFFIHNRYFCMVTKSNDMKYWGTSLLLLLISWNIMSGQKKKADFTVMFYNVENLFDTINNPDYDDDEFTPSGEKHWDYDRYEKKLSDIARVILSPEMEEAPAVIGFAEVENSGVLEDLSEIRSLRKYKYQPVLVDGNDPRGIDCGMLYREDMFHVSSYELLPVKDLSGKDYPLRGILHVAGEAPDGQPIHLFINHWKSRWGGTDETENLRIYAAITLRRALDQLLSEESDPRYIIMGDFNDEPTNRSLYEVLHAGNKRKNLQPYDSYNLFYDQHNMEDKGSNFYRGDWEMLDQIILSYTLLNRKSSLSASYDGGHILKKDWMLYHDEKNDRDTPNRTYGGNNYYGGISDHLPVYVIFTW